MINNMYAIVLYYYILHKKGVHVSMLLIPLQELFLYKLIICNINFL